MNTIKSNSDIQESWDIVIKPVKGWLNINIKEIIRYRDLIIFKQIKS